MRRHPFRVTRLGAVLTVAVGLLTPMAANMVGAQAGLPVVIAQETPVVTVSPVRPRGFHPPSSGVRPNPRADRAAGRDRGPVDERPRPCPGHDRRRTRVRGRTHAQVGVVPGGSKYFGFPIVAWVEEVSDDGRWGRVELPTRGRGARAGSDSPGSPARPRGSASRSTSPDTCHRPEARPGAVPGTGGDGIAVFPDAGRRVLRHGSGGVLARQLLGSFAFGISGIQPWLPAGWSGGNQLAIHGTNNPSSIGRSASAGCVRVSETTLARLLPLLRYGTPVIVHA